MPSDTDEAIGFFDQAGDIWWGHPLSADGGEIVIGRPTGDRAALSDVDRHLVITGLRHQLAYRRDAYPLGRRA